MYMVEEYQGLEQDASSKKKIFLGLGALVLLLAVLVLTIGPGWAASYYYKQGEIEFKKGDHARAKGLFERSLKFNSRFSESHFYLGMIALGKPTDAPGAENYFPNADYRQALKYFEEAIGLGIEKKVPDFYAQSLHYSGFSYLMLKETDKANEKFELLIEKFPNSSFYARYLLARDYFERLNKPQEALEILLPAPNQVISEIHKKYTLYEVYNLLARIYFFFDDFTNGKKYAELAITSSGGRRDISVMSSHINLAIAAGANGDFVLAEAEIRIASGMAPSKINNFFDCYLAQAYYVGKEYKRAIEIAKLAPRPNAYVGSTCINVLAKSNLALQNKTEAKNYFEQYLSFSAPASVQKNALIIRERERAQKALESLQ